MVIQMAVGADERRVGKDGKEYRSLTGMEFGPDASCKTQLAVGVKSGHCPPESQQGLMVTVKILSLRPPRFAGPMEADGVVIPAGAKK